MRFQLLDLPSSCLFCASSIPPLASSSAPPSSLFVASRPIISLRFLHLCAPTLRSVVKSGIMEPKLTEEDCDFKGLPPKDKDVEKRLMGKFTTPVHGNTSSTTKNPLWAQIPADKTIVSAGAGLSDADIEQRLPGVAVDALSKSSEEFVVVSGQNPVKSLGLLCFKEEDSQTLLGQMKAMDPIMRPGSKVVPVVLSMALPYIVFQPQAFELCLRKVAASSRDMRKALGICRGAIERLEIELRESTYTSNLRCKK
ncbi:hypothetical protein L2E82_27737 [Cichorium intybus]|uniref:Uncharacterized protein n=1 Tax=Cichorium intybus TaxID=13427 RepID=A0ACB9CTZ7_CICIN|nr:hypothetical protein L2E82_27737 [Cichorium intybus]